MFLCPRQAWITVMSVPISTCRLPNECRVQWKVIFLVMPAARSHRFNGPCSILSLSSAIKILTAKPNVNLRFMFEYLSYWELKSEGHKRHYISEIASLVIELPSKERQSIIASLMTSLNSKLDIEAKTKIRYEEQKRYLLSQMFI